MRLEPGARPMRTRVREDSSRPGRRAGGLAAACALGLSVLLGQAHTCVSQGRLPTIPSSAALLPPGAATMSVYVPASDQRLSKAGAGNVHAPGNGFYPAASSTFKLFGETLNANGGHGQDWGQDGEELAVTIAQDVVKVRPPCVCVCVRACVRAS